MSWLTPALFTLTPHVGAFIGGAFTDNASLEWYEKLNKPRFTPPTWVFGPVWLCLNTSVGYSSWLVYRDGGGVHGAARLPLAVYGASMLLQSAYSPITFGLKRLGLGTIDMLLLTCGAAGCVYSFRAVSSTASRLLLPWLGWLAFASLLNVLIWRGNREEAVESSKKA